MSEISRDEVEHIAKLARLALKPEELDQLAVQIDGIVANVSRVQEVAAEGIVPMSHPHSIETPMRDDEVHESLPVEAALNQAPAAEDQRFVVPQILGESN